MGRGGGASSALKERGIESFAIRPAREDDWPRTLETSAHYLWDVLSLDRQEGSSLALVRTNLQRAIDQIRGPQGMLNEAFIMEDAHGLWAGYVWLCRRQDEWTGQVEGFVLDVNVDPQLRGRGLGRRLMEWAERWARQRGYPRLSLSVFASNAAARHLYDSLGYPIDSLRMSKRL